MNQLNRRTCRPGAPRQALHDGTAANDGNKQQQRAATATPIIRFSPSAGQAVATTAPLCSACGHPLALPYVLSPEGARHLRCLGGVTLRLPRVAEGQVAA